MLGNEKLGGCNRSLFPVIPYLMSSNLKGGEYVSQKMWSDPVFEPKNFTRYLPFLLHLRYVKYY